MAHTVNSSAESLMGKSFPVLDSGFVELIDYLGSDERITEAARVSYKNTKTKSEDGFLIDYLLRNDHTSPFEQVVFTFHVKMPIFVARQWVRHRTARINEISGRYSIMAEEFYMPSADNMNKQSKDNKQGRGEKLSPAEFKKAVSLIDEVYKTAGKNYSQLIEMGVAKEISRIVLPLSLYTEFYWQIDLHNLFHFLALRLDSHAQYEIREYAKVIFEILEKVCPLASAAFKKHKLNGISLSDVEVRDIKKRIKGTATSLSERDGRILTEKLSKTDD